jgi:hypothetical protein
MFFTVVGPNIRFGLGAVKGVGEGAVESILEARRSAGRFTSLLQFCEVVDLRACNKKAMEALIKSGSFDFLNAPRKALLDSLDATADSAQRTKDEKERGQHSLFGLAPSAAPQPPKYNGGEWSDEEKLRYEKETLGFYITGHPLNKYADDITRFATKGVNTETLYRFVDQQVDIAGIVSQMKRSKIKKGPNEGKLMAKFILDDQYGSVDVVVFSDLYTKHAKWLDNGVAVLLTATVKDTGGMNAGRSASLQSAEQAAQHIDDEYGGHPESRRISAYDVSIEDVEDDRDPKEIEREKYGDRTNNFDLFEGPLTPPPVAEETDFSSHAASFHEAPITPELNALDIIPLDGIRDRKVKEIAVEVRYADMSEERIRRMREIFEDHAGEIPVTVTIVDVPEALGGSNVRMRINGHFRVQPGAALADALRKVEANPQYVF